MCQGDPMSFQIRGRHLSMLGLLTAILAAGCASFTSYGDGILKGRVLVQWDRQDEFIYIKGTNPVSFRPSFFKGAHNIVPETMYTTGGSVPQIFWGIPGLSPWALGPAYIIHDWIFLVHRCDLPAPPEVKAITFDQSAQILAEVGKSLVDAGLIKDNKLEEIVWAVRTKYAQSLWERPPTQKECETPIVTAAARKRLGLPQSKTVVDFTIPPPRR
jgi:hypothetical protein